MTAPYPIVRVPPDAHKLEEPLGTKFKFWFFAVGDRKVLFKRGRANEDWSEKVAAELARHLGLPAAQVDLAEFEGTNGITSPSFLAADEQLFHGNELLAGLREGYPMHERYKVGQHTLAAVFSALSRLDVRPTPPAASPALADACDQMVGYLLLDALVGNTDRHHENWAIVQRGSVRYLAPTYDHASSLGRNEPEEKVAVRLGERDPRVTVETYVARCRSAFFADEASRRTMGTLDAFGWAARHRPDAARYWLARLADVSQEALTEVMNRIPSVLISDPHRTFGVRILRTNARRLARVASELDG